MSKQIRVLHVIEGLFEFGGTPIKLYHQITNSSADYHYTVCCLVNEGGVADKLRSRGVEVINLKLRNSLDISKLFKLIRLIKDKEIDIVHTHFARSHIYGRLAALFTGKPMISSEHGILRNTIAPVVLAENILNLVCNYNISNSIATLNSVKKHVKLNQDNMSVIYNGVPDVSEETNKYNSQEVRKAYGLKEDDFVILDIGSHIPLRDHITLIKAVARINGKIPNLRVIQAGEGATGESLMRAVEENELKDVVTFLGTIKNTEVHKLMSISNIYVNPALLEGFGIATVEAMQFELPVICANSGSLPELIEDGVDGLLFKPEDEVDLARKIMELYESEPERKRLGSAARTSALEKFGIERFVKEFEDLYVSMVKA